MMESVMCEEQDESGVEEPWYIKVEGEGEGQLDVPVFRPQGQILCHVTLTLICSLFLYSYISVNYFVLKILQSRLV